ncbi:MAG: amidohydrolase family protein [Chloroflexi bacterium]|nr:amidohydrolase family protein [Chloroflexota bacterium]
MPYDGLGMSIEERRDSWTMCPPWWATPARNTLDRATATLPRLLHERMDDIGLDFAVLYPSQGLHFFRLQGSQDDELRRVFCRAVYTYNAELYGPYADRMTPAAVIPMHTPREAIDELEHSVNVLGLKAAVLAGHVYRPIPSVHREHPEFSAVAHRLDTFGLDSEYDYDPVWAKCVELKVAPTFHSGGMGWGSRRSISNYMYNHLGHFAAASDALCKSLFMGGVTRRFPTLRFGFLECGVAWACSLYADIVGHWEKRNAEAIMDLDPAVLDVEHMMNLVAEYGPERAVAKSGDLAAFFSRRHARPDSTDEWRHCRIEKAEDIRDLFVPNFFFGCEADDPMNAWAFNGKVNPFGARLRAMVSSDIGHWDVPDMREVLAEAYELVEHEQLTETDFRDFTFTNAVKLHAGMNPDFFKGTVVEQEVEALIRRGL